MCVCARACHACNGIDTSASIRTHQCRGRAHSHTQTHTAALHNHGAQHHCATTTLHSSRAQQRCTIAHIRWGSLKGHASLVPATTLAQPHGGTTHGWGREGGRRGEGLAGGTHVHAAVGGLHTHSHQQSWHRLARDAGGALGQQMSTRYSMSGKRGCGSVKEPLCTHTHTAQLRGRIHKSVGQLHVHHSPHPKGARK